MRSWTRSSNCNREGNLRPTAKEIAERGGRVAPLRVRPLRRPRGPVPRGGQAPRRAGLRDARSRSRPPVRCGRGPRRSCGCAAGSRKRSATSCGRPRSRRRSRPPWPAGSRRPRKVTSRDTRARLRRGARRRWPSTTGSARLAVVNALAVTRRGTRCDECPLDVPAARKATADGIISVLERSPTLAGTTEVGKS